MSVEVAATNYTFTEGESQRMRPAGSRSIFGDPWRRRSEDVEDGLPKKQPTTLQRFYNPIHDMESVVWLFFYFLLHRDVYLRPILPRLAKDYGTYFVLSISISSSKAIIQPQGLGRKYSPPPTSSRSRGIARGAYQSTISTHKRDVHHAEREASDNRL